MNHLPPPLSQQYFMPDHLLDTSSYFDCYHQQHHLQYPIPTVSTSSEESSSSSLLPMSSSHFTSSGAPPYEQQLSPSSTSSHILITPPSVIPTLSPISTSPFLTFGSPMAEYSIAQIEAIATSLFQAREGARLVAFFDQIKSIYGPSLENFQSEPIIVAYTYSLYHANEFERLFHLLATRPFHQSFFGDLQDIWHHARYKESQLKRGKELNPVEKYRLRRKFPPPKTIWDGEETVYSFKDSSRKYLKKYFQDTTAYPSQEQKREISKQTGLKIVQISNWFKNRRQRDKTDNSDRSPPSSSSSTNGSNEFPPLSTINPQNLNFVGVPFNVQHMNMFFDSN